MSYYSSLLGTVLGEYRPVVFFVRTSLRSVRTVKTSGPADILPVRPSCLVAKNIGRIIKAIAAIWGENMLGYLSLDIICSS